MKLLILILSYNKAPFSDFMRVSQETWDFEKHSNIDVIYYYGDENGFGWNFNTGKELQVNCSDDYEMMHWKFKMALDAIDYHKYDLIFRTNSCSYIVKERILKVAETLPKIGCYAGYHNGSYISGAGIFFSPDVLDILQTELTDIPHGAEDVLIGHILKDAGIEMTSENSRIDATVKGIESGFETEYHYRFKTSNDVNDRYRDVNNMKKLHSQLYENRITDNNV